MESHANEFGSGVSVELLRNLLSLADGEGSVNHRHVLVNMA
jgi:hypothetical protein